jgi:ATP-dependent Clp protease ATP-binding subunit ClpB
MHTKYLPAKAVELLELVSVRVAQTKGEGAIVTKDDIAEVVSEATSIPVSKVTEKESDVLLNMEDKIHKRMINQEEAVNMVASSLRRARAEMREGKRPIANFLFLGPTGVGKTELAKTVSEIYFGNEKNMIRLDMSEYQHPDSVKKMIGSTAGGRGYLTEAVRKAPFSLILLDEFEKAHPDILNLFLQVMDDGRLTDGQGRTIDFTNSIIIATSNAGAVYIQEQVAQGTDIEKIKDVLINERLNKILRPELINRFDGIVVFKPLARRM